MQTRQELIEATARSINVSVAEAHALARSEDEGMKAPESLLERTERMAKVLAPQEARGQVASQKQPINESPKISTEQDAASWDSLHPVISSTPKKGVNSQLNLLTYYGTWL